MILEGLIDKISPFFYHVSKIINRKLKRNLDTYIEQSDIIKQIINFIK